MTIESTARTGTVALSTYHGTPRRRLGRTKGRLGGQAVAAWRAR